MTMAPFGTSSSLTSAKAVLSRPREGLAHEPCHELSMDTPNSKNVKPLLDDLFGGYLFVRQRTRNGSGVVSGVVTWK